MGMLATIDCLETMRSHSTEWLEVRRREVVAEIRRLQSEEHSILLVLDERGRVDVLRGLDGESARTVRQKVETARALEGLRREDSVHAAGVVIGDAPLVNYLPLKLSKDSRDDSKKVVTQFSQSGERTIPRPFMTASRIFA